MWTLQHSRGGESKCAIATGRLNDRLHIRMTGSGKVLLQLIDRRHHSAIDTGLFEQARQPGHFRATGATARLGAGQNQNPHPIRSVKSIVGHSGVVRSEL